jgi:hypothetical protein
MKVKFLFQVHSNFASVSSGDIYLKKELELPFLPSIGLVVKSGKWECDPIEEIVYDASVNTVTAYCGEDKQVYDARLHNRTDAPSLNSIVADYTEAGWEVDETI